MITDDYLDYLINEAKWKRKLAAGELSDKDLMRIKKAGLPKSKRKWVAGVEKGTAAIQKKKGIRQTHKVAMGGVPKYKEKVGATLKGKKDIEKAHSVTGTAGQSTVHVATQVPKKKRVLSAIVKRHETEEAGAGQRLSTYKGKRRGFRGYPQMPGGEYPHASPEVLRREKELTRTAKGLYGKKETKEVEKTRKKEKKQIALDKKMTKWMEKKATKRQVKRNKELKQKIANLTPVERKLLAKSHMKKDVPGSKKGKKRYLKIMGVIETMHLSEESKQLDQELDDAIEEAKEKWSGIPGDPGDPVPGRAGTVNFPTGKEKKKMDKYTSFKRDKDSPAEKYIASLKPSDFGIKEGSILEGIVKDAIKAVKSDPKVQQDVEKIKSDWKKLKSLPQYAKRKKRVLAMRRMNPRVRKAFKTLTDPENIKRTRQDVAKRFIGAMSKIKKVKEDTPIEEVTYREKKYKKREKRKTSAPAKMRG